MEIIAYEDCKPSAMESTGNIPAHWSENRIKFYLSFIGSGKTPLGGANVYVDEGIKLLRSQNVHDSGVRLSEVVFITDEADALQAGTRVRESDVLLNITGASIGRTSIVNKEVLPANVNQHVCILRPINTCLLPEYLHKLLCSKIAKEQILKNENGTSREGLNFAQIANLFFPVPDIPEQKLIVAFLDHKTQQIDQLIAKKQTLIDKLNEQRIALITHAVTKGLNPAATLKESGVEWLGEVPEHWDVRRAKFVSNIFIPQRNKPELNLDKDGLPWVTMEEMGAREISDATRYVSNSAASEADSKSLSPSSVIASCVGNFGIASINRVPVIINQQLQAFMPTNISEEYLLHIVLISKSYFELIGTAATLVYVNRLGFEGMPVPFPPIEEQRGIVAHLDKETARIDRMMELNQQTIDKLKEYRTALITAAVTGKIDLRNWQQEANHANP